MGTPHDMIQRKVGVFDAAPIKQTLACDSLHSQKSDRCPSRLILMTLFQIFCAIGSFEARMSTYNSTSFLFLTDTTGKVEKTFASDPTILNPSSGKAICSNFSLYKSSKVWSIFPCLNSLTFSLHFTVPKKSSRMVKSCSCHLDIFLFIAPIGKWMSKSILFSS